MNIGCSRPVFVMRSIGVSLMSTSSTLSRLVGLEIVRLHRHALDAEAVILQDQFLGDLRIFTR
jgi:hypothetical protein